MTEVKKLFNPEFLNRVDEVIVFHPLDKRHLRSIVTLMINELKQRLEEHMLELYFTDDASEFLMEKGYDPTFGARPLRRTIQKYVEDPLVEKLLREDVTPGDTVAIDVTAESDQLSFEIVKTLTGAEQS